MIESLAALVRILRKIGGYMTPEDQMELFKAEQMLLAPPMSPAPCGCVCDEGVQCPHGWRRCAP